MAPNEGMNHPSVNAELCGLVRSARTPSVLSLYLCENRLSTSQRAKIQFLELVQHVTREDLVPGDPAVSSCELDVTSLERVSRYFLLR
jgi:hypothetical protein